jgi:hypothetical protein
MPHVRLAIILLYTTAARSSALCGLTWDRCGFDSSRIDLRDPTISRPHKGRAIVPCYVRRKLYSENLPDWRIVPGSYMMTTFSIGYPKDRPIGAAFANKFIEEMKENGFIQKAIDGAKLKGAIVPK